MLLCTLNVVRTQMICFQYTVIISEGEYKSFHNFICLFSPAKPFVPRHDGDYKGEIALEELVRVEHINKNYHTVKAQTEVVADLSFSVYKEEFLSIIGPSGCGKTTVLSLIAGLIPPSGGKITLENEEVTGYSELVAYMLQRDHLFEWRTIEENIVLGLQVRKKCTKEARRKANELLEKYGLGDFKKYYPQQLSGGMRQKVALIRTLAVDPELLLLDEPFSALDYQTRLALSDEISEIIRTEKKTAVLVTHDIAEAISMSDRVLVLSVRPTTVKTELKIEFDDMSAPPIHKRQDEKFRDYFDFLWKELAVHVE